MPYQVLPGLVVISVAFSLMGVGYGAVNKWQARNNMQVRSPFASSKLVRP
jgi:hypothetical protein